MSTGTLPFHGETSGLIFKAILDCDPPPAIRFNRNIPPKLEDIINRALEKDRELRYQTAKEMRAELHRLKRDTDTARSTRPSSGSVTGVQRRGTNAAKIAVLSILVTAALIAGGLSYRSHRAKPLTEKDTVVLTDFTNNTGDPVFDDTLKTALTVSLKQSPFLNVLSDSNVAKTLELMEAPSDTKLTPGVARELCQRAGSKAYIAGSIASLGSQYVLGLKAVNCLTGDVLVQEQVTSSAKENVLDALGGATSKLRGELGESLASVQKLDVPLSEATTSSLEALQSYTLGEKHQSTPVTALPYDLRAIRLDPNFAIGYEAVGTDYLNLNEFESASEYLTKAFELREHASTREKMQISAAYYMIITGELTRAAQIFQEDIENYPRDSGSFMNLGLVYAAMGRYSDSTEIQNQALRLIPDDAAPYGNLANSLLAQQRLAEAQQIIQQAQAHKLDYSILHSDLYALGFLRSDSSMMEEQQGWFAGSLESYMGLSLASDTEAYARHLLKARELSKRSIESAIHADSKETAAIWSAMAAQREAAFGNAVEAHHKLVDVLKLAPTSRDVEVEAALAFAMAGDNSKAESIAHSLSNRFPLDTQMQSLWLPAIRAQVALNRGNPPEALRDLQITTGPIELGDIFFVPTMPSCLYPTYIRGLAYMTAGQGTLAADEFQKILDHSGIVWNCWTGALARLGIARANMLQAKKQQGAGSDAARVRALAAYKDFLTLWKDADPDIPILKEAKAEYARLQ